MSIAIQQRMVSGFVGASVLTWLHQVAQRVRSDAPRMDLVGMEVTARALAGTGTPVPDRERLFVITLVGDLVSNGVYYSAIPASSRTSTWTRAAVLGAAAGLGALFLPRYLVGVDPPYSYRLANNIMTVAWYLAGGLATAAVSDLLACGSGSRASDERVAGSMAM